MYTSGTTGKPKGVVRNHRGYYLLASITAVELSISKEDNALNSYAICVMQIPLIFFAHIYLQVQV